MNTNTILNGWNAVVHLPASYPTSTNSYPVIYFVPGLGEIGTNVALAKKYGPNAYIQQGWDGKINGREYIVISIQPPASYPRPWTVKGVLDAAEVQYRIDKTKTCMTGLSMGGWAAYIFTTYKATPNDSTYLNRIKCVVSVEGMKADDTYDATSPYPQRFADLASAGCKSLNFEQSQDFRDLATVTNTMNAAVANSSVFYQTTFGNGSHCCWDSFYGGNGTLPSIFGNTGTLYNFIDTKLFATPANQLPIVNAGPDATVIISNPITLSGTVSDPDGVIASVNWTQVSGPASTIVTPNSITTNILVQGPGVYEYKLTATDNQGGSASDNIIVTVNAAPPVRNVLKTITLYDDGTYTMV